MDKWLALVSQLAPIILMTVPGGAALAPLAPVIIGAIQSAEQIKDASGVEKRARVQEIVKAAIVTTNTVAKKTVLDPTATLALSGVAIDTVVGTVNLVNATHDAVVDKPGVTAGPTGMA